MAWQNFLSCAGLFYDFIKSFDISCRENNNNSLEMSVIVILIFANWSNRGEKFLLAEIYQLNVERAEQILSEFQRVPIKMWITNTMIFGVSMSTTITILKDTYLFLSTNVFPLLILSS